MFFRKKVAPIIDSFKEKKSIYCKNCKKEWTINKNGKTIIQVTIFPKNTHENVLSYQFNNGDSDVNFCPECAKKGAIRCAWCGDFIVFGQPVTLYTPREKDFKVPEHAVIYSEDPLQLVGCLGWNCASTGGDRAGFWVPSGDPKIKGKVRRVMTPIEQCFAQFACGEDGVVVVGDISNPRESTPRI